MIYLRKHPLKFTDQHVAISIIESCLLAHVNATCVRVIRNSIFHGWISRAADQTQAVQKSAGLVNFKRWPHKLIREELELSPKVMVEGMAIQMGP